MARRVAVEQTISLQIVHIARAHRALAAELLSPIGLHPGQELLLVRLATEGGSSQRDLAERLCVEPPTLTKMLQRVEQHGLIDRRPDPDDARTTRVSLSAKGEELLREIDEAWTELERRTVASLTVDEQATLRMLLSKVNAALDGDTADG